MPFVPNTDADRQEMLQRTGANSFDDLITDIPQSARMKRPLEIKPLAEMDLLREMQGLAAQNRSDLLCFAGGGIYDHFIPSAVGAVISRPEFMTAYTPYQAEVAQGTLQVIYEFQTHICRLTGMDVANASMYDGATAAAEAAMICTGLTRRNKVIVPESLNPMYRQVLATYLGARDINLVTIPLAEGRADLNLVESAMDDTTACVIMPQPNFFGLIEDIEAVATMLERVGGKLVMSVDPIAQAILKTPAEYGADIVVGEGQPLGVPMSFGGPLVGFFAAKKELIRRMPGRLAARTKDVDGRDGFVLTLQTREQHIRRDKATSNICTNQALCATAVSVYMSLLGKQGLREVALHSAERAQTAAEKIFALDGYEPYFSAPFVREFAVRTPVPARRIILGMTERGVLPGVEAGRWYPGLDDCLVVALTEKRTDDDLARLIAGLKELAQSHVLSTM